MINRANIDASRALHTADRLSLVEASKGTGQFFRKPHTRTSSPTNCLLSANMLTLHFSILVPLRYLKRRTDSYAHTPFQSLEPIEPTLTGSKHFRLIGI